MASRGLGRAVCPARGVQEDAAEKITIAVKTDRTVVAGEGGRFGITTVGAALETSPSEPRRWLG